MEELAHETTMVPSDWITLAAVIVALAIGIISLLHTGSIQRRQYRHQLLQEIIDWAVNVQLYDLHTDVSDFRDIVKQLLGKQNVTKDELEAMSKAMIRAYENIDIGNRWVAFKRVIAQGEHILDLSDELSDSLASKVKLLRIHIQAHVKLIERHVDEPKEVYKQRISLHRPFLDTSAIEVIHEALRIRRVTNRWYRFW